MAIDVLDIEKTYDYIKGKDYKILDCEIQEIPFFENGIRFFTILGPNEEKIEFNQRL
jgi:hypothetical protein